MEVRDINLILDFVLIAASIWMVYTVRDVGGIVGRTLNFIVIGTVILGIAHLLATFTGRMDDTFIRKWDGTIHRTVVLSGFLFLVYGFRQLRAMR